jgi:hypothetical protein
MAHRQEQWQAERHKDEDNGECELLLIAALWRRQA